MKHGLFDQLTGTEFLHYAFNVHVTKSLTTWSTVFEQLTGTHLLKNFPHFIETGSSLPLSKQHAICPYPECEQYSQCHIYLLRGLFEYYSPTYAKLIKVYPFLRFPNKTLYANICSTYMLHRFPISFLLIWSL